MKILLVIAFFIMMVVVIVAATLIKNQARFFEPPGFAERLSTYIGQHTAATSDNHAFPELQTPVFHVGAERLFGAVMESVNDLGWQVMESDDENLKAVLVIATPILRFKDDLVVQVKLRNSQFNAEESSLYIHSSSRVGKADFAANAGHIQTLIERVRKKLNRG
jgi:uncharacterized protein (DUF1499 family)